MGNFVAVRDGDHDCMREGGAHDNIVDRVFRLRVARFTGGLFSWLRLKLRFLPLAVTPYQKEVVMRCTT